MPGSGTIEIVRQNNNPDTMQVRLGKALAGAAIDDALKDVVLPTIDAALRAGRDSTLREVQEVIARQLNSQLSELTGPHIKEIVRGAIAQEFGDKPESRIEILDRARDRTVYLSRQHYMFEAVLQLMTAVDANGCPLNVSLVGPAGNGKTTLALRAADALDVSVVLQPWNPQTTKSELLGYMDANGKYVESPFYRAFKEGRLYIADEFDAANPAVAIILNAAVANRMLTFPNGETVRAHPDFRAAFIMNTYGTGADHQYTGRFRQDAATLDRFVYLQLPIDPGLEAALAGEKKVQSPKIDIAAGGRFASKKEILTMVQSVRAAVKALNLNYIVSPRATLYACAMHEAGFGKELIMECCVWHGMPTIDREAISQAVEKGSSIHLHQGHADRRC